MNLEDVKKILTKPEGTKIEFKEARNTTPSSLYETVVSFSNTDGGTIILGAANDGSVIGIDSGSVGQIQTDIVTALNDRSCINPPLYLIPEIFQYTDGTIMAIQIPSSSQIHDHAGKIYFRESDADIDITKQQSKIADLYHRKRTLFTEGEIYEHLGMKDLDNSLFKKARTLIRNYKSDHPWLLTDNLQMLKDSILWKKDFSTGKEGFTLAAALIFGKDQTIQSILPAYKVEAIVRIRNKDRWDDRITLRTNLIDTYLQLKEFINKKLPEKFFMEGDQRIDLRDKIFREVIGNIIVHREYTNALSTDLIITENEVLFTNPNKALFHGPLNPASFNPFAKNPNIRKFFTAFGWTDEIGSGIRNTFRYLPFYVPGAKPLFIENDIFKTEIPLVFVTLENYAKQLVSWLDLPVKVLDRIQPSLLNIALPSNLSTKGWEDILLYLVPSWHINGTQYHQLKWPEKQIFTKKIKNPVPSHGKKVPSSIQKGTKLDKGIYVDYQEDIVAEIKKVPSWSEKGTKLLSNKSVYLLSILTLSSSPIKREELMEVLEYANRKSFTELYLQPLIQSGLVKRTHEENHRDPNQQYYLTELGKTFLGGTC